MNLLFICAGLEPGRDGVGDYVRLLAGACIAQGHACAVLALHDAHVTRIEDHTSEGLRLLRLPAAEPWASRLAFAAAEVGHLAPDWVSWQVVSYGFHPSGFLPAPLIAAAPSLRGARCHVMLHELWLGLECGASVRERTLGWVQSRGVLRLLAALAPQRLHTSNATYRAALACEAHKARVLPLFGNMPIGPGPREASACLVGATFGTLHPQWRPAETVAWLRATAQRHARPPALLVIGRAGAHATRILRPFRDAGVAVTETGPLDHAEVSRLFAGADFGIAPHPWALIGKSGAAAALLDHGLPVLVPRDEWHLRAGDAHAAEAGTGDALLTRLDGLDEVATDRWLASRRAPAPSLPRVAAAFLLALKIKPSRS